MADPVAAADQIPSQWFVYLAEAGEHVVEVLAEMKGRPKWTDPHARVLGGDPP
jgi:hypothetical protein